jgi:hypothetical protein
MTPPDLTRRRFARLCAAGVAVPFRSASRPARSARLESLRAWPLKPARMTLDRFHP